MIFSVRFCSLYDSLNCASGLKLSNDVIKSLFSNLLSCLFSSFGGRGAALGEGRHEAGTLKILGGSFGTRKPPRIFFIGVSFGQCARHIQNVLRLISKPTL